MAKTFRELSIYEQATRISDVIWDWREQLRRESPAIWYQIDKAAGSIEDNIAEGFGRESRADFANFLRYSRGSAMETESQIARARRRGLIADPAAEEAIQMCRTVTIHIRNLQAKLRDASHYQKHSPNQLRDTTVKYESSDLRQTYRDLPTWWDRAQD